jgi:hypothetical protein
VQIRIVAEANAYLARRIASLPYDSEARLAVLKLFRCYSLATALLLLENVDGEERVRVEQALDEIFERTQPS